MAAAVGFALVLAGCSSAPASEPAPSKTVEDTTPITIRMAVVSSVASLGVWAADAEGFFKKNNLDMKIDGILTPVAAQVPSLLGKQYDIGHMTPPTLITAANSGLDVVAVSANYVSEKTVPAVLVIASPKSGIKTIKDLAGKRMATPSIAGNVNTGTMYWLQKNGVDPKSVTVVAAANANVPDLLRAGQIDAAQMLMPYSGMMLGEGYTNLGSSMEALGTTVQMAFWGANGTWAKDNPEAIKRFKKALDEAGAWIKDNPEKALDLYLEKTKVPAEFKKDIQIPTYSTKLTGPDLDQWVTAMKAVTGFTTSLDMKSLIYNPK